MMKQITPFASVLGLAVACLATPSLAQEAMTAEEFDAYTRGKTLFYGQDGAAYGAEIYMDNRQVRWSFLDGVCKEGEWYESAGQICFVYDDNPNPQCWTFHRDGTGLSARFQNTPDGTELYEADNPGQEMICLAPNTGV